jgi:hypothetical protein
MPQSSVRCELRLMLLLCSLVRCQGILSKFPSDEGHEEDGGVPTAFSKVNSNKLSTLNIGVFGFISVFNANATENSSHVRRDDVYLQGKVPEERGAASVSRAFACVIKLAVVGARLSLFRHGVCGGARWSDGRTRRRLFVGNRRCWMGLILLLCQLFLFPTIKLFCTYYQSQRQV